MTISNFMIGPIKDATRKDLKPFATPEDSFENMINAYQFRGRIVRRKGYTLLGQLANGTPVMGLKTLEGFNVGVQSLIAFDLTNAYKFNGSAFVALPSVMPTTWNGADYQFFFTTNYANAFWATNFDTNNSGNSGLNGYKISSFSGATATTVQVTTSPANNFLTGDQVYFVNVTGTTAATNNLRFGTVTTPGNPFTFTATDGGVAFTNGASPTGIALSTTRQTPGQDGVRFYGNLTNGIGWANYNPPIDPNTALAGALMIFPYRGYLVFLNTWEGNDQGVFNFGNRARWTATGTPYYQFPVPNSPSLMGVNPTTMRDDLFGQGGATDAPTNEVIVSAGFIRDILVVYFERSTWRLRFVNNAQNPFVWERVNVELGSDCTFSSIIFDKGLMAISNRGIVISDANDTIRFDEKIPDTIFQIRQANNGFDRVQGIRTFETKLNYWTYPSIENPTGIYPDLVLVFNYDTRNWSFFDDCFTTFGYYYPAGNSITWGDLTEPWAETYETWDSGSSADGSEHIVAGNQQGYVFDLEQGGWQNSPSLTISALTDSSVTDAIAVFTSTNNNLPDGTWVTITGVTGTTSSDGVSLNGRNFKLNNPTLDPNEFMLSEFKPIDGGAASGTSYTYTVVLWKNILAGSPQINVGSLVFTDPEANGVLVEASSLGSGTINYATGQINLTFSPSIGSTEVYIRLVTLDPGQGLSSLNTLGTYTGGGQITKISNYDVTTKIFNFLGNDQRARLSKIDFYVNSTTNGQFTCNVFSDSSNEIVNMPLSDNLQSNVVLTSTNPYQFGQGVETIFRLYCDAIAQTIQLQLTLSDAQMAVNSINQADIELLAMMFTLRRGGRLI